MLSAPNALAAPPEYPAGTLAAYFQDEQPQPPIAGEVHEAEANSEDEVTADAAESDALASDCADDCATDCECGEEASECGEEVEGCGCEVDANGDLCCGWNLGCGCCDLGDAWKLQTALCPCEKETTYGGWFQFGYHSHVTGQSQEYGDLLDFNDVPHQVNLHQAWFYAENLADTESCSPDFGYRFDMLYGTDAQKTQAFGNSGAPDAQGWDNDWDHGVYGWAIPQLYAEIGYQDWSVKVGHFFTPLGYEVIPATGNFFYSHALTMFNSEPFTHTGVLGTYKGYEDVTVYAGWTLGWDTGFDQYRGGNNWLGGVTLQATDDVSFTYLNTAGNFGFRSADEFGYSHSIVSVVDLSEKMKYVFQSDLVDTEGFLGDEDQEGHDVGVNQYLFYTMNDCWGLGGRMEWWKSNTSSYNFGESTSYYEITGGINYKAHANVIVRPEIRYDWTPTDTDEDYDRAIFGVDVICTY
jgi:hypothetical protein